MHSVSVNYLPNIPTAMVAGYGLAGKLNSYNSSVLVGNWVEDRVLKSKRIFLENPINSTPPENLPRCLPLKQAGNDEDFHYLKLKCAVRILLFRC